MTAATAPLVGYQPPAVPWNGLTVTDLFCGAGGSSSGLREAGYKVVHAANHWALAIESHQINHPGLVVPLRNHGVAKPASHPIDTVSAEGNHHALVMRNNTARGDGGQMSTPVHEPLRALTTAGHQSLIEPSEPISLDVDDAGFRMLEPHEIQAGMGFARDYLLLGSKRDKVKQAGNAVTPPAARDLGHAVAEFLLAVAS
ncbi:DNA cytosine methyltransferase [Microbacterium sp. UMB0228]|uniref:DNA cytosine methyltransferase n=1 Tax=Microbacterium sp. UMB0228 TaxID=2029109 RepID=UPI001CA5EB72|nr:DNA cytosine methyltransferase [Microbacterium sp. UMB0228]